MMLLKDWYILLLAGGAGAFVKDVLKDNRLRLPHYNKGYLYLGCVGGIIIGGFAGYVVDNDPVTAFLGGYAGYQIIESLINNKDKEK